MWGSAVWICTESEPCVIFRRTSVCPSTCGFNHNRISSSEVCDAFAVRMRSESCSVRVQRVCGNVTVSGSTFAIVGAITERSRGATACTAIGSAVGVAQGYFSFVAAQGVIGDINVLFGVRLQSSEVTGACGVFCGRVGTVSSAAVMGRSGEIPFTKGGVLCVILCCVAIGFSVTTVGATAERSKERPACNAIDSVCGTEKGRFSSVTELGVIGDRSAFLGVGSPSSNAMGKVRVFCGNAEVSFGVVNSGISRYMTLPVGVLCVRTPFTMNGSAERPTIGYKRGQEKGSSVAVKGTLPSMNTAVLLRDRR